mgnify:CR=1 FL=1
MIFGYFVSYPRFKQRVAYILPDQSNLAAVLESVRISDSVLFLWSLQDFIDEDGEKLYSCLYAQGLPSVAHAVMVCMMLSNLLDSVVLETHIFRLQSLYTKISLIYIATKLFDH